MLLDAGDEEVSTEPKRQCYTCKFSEPTNRRSTATPLPSDNNHYGRCTLRSGKWKLWDDGCERWQVESSPYLEHVLFLNGQGGSPP